VTTIVRLEGPVKRFVVRPHYWISR